MNRRTVILVLLAISAFPCFAAGRSAAITNPKIDMEGYLMVAVEAAKHRETRRLSEEEFIAKIREPGTIVLDARSREKYDELHVEGAINLSFPDIAVESLARVIPDKSTRILIYCNNNFSNAEGPFPTKIASASLNLSTFIALYSYGYRNIWELGPQIDLESSRLKFEAGQRSKVIGQSRQGEGQGP